MILFISASEPIYDGLSMVKVNSGISFKTVMIHVAPRSLKAIFGC